MRNEQYVIEESYCSVVFYRMFRFDVYLSSALMYMQVELMALVIVVVVVVVVLMLSILDQV